MDDPRAGCGSQIVIRRTVTRRLYMGGQLVGDRDIVREMRASGELEEIIAAKGADR